MFDGEAHAKTSQALYGNVMLVIDYGNGFEVTSSVADQVDAVCSIGCKLKPLFKSN
jgi:hypothetical protein